MKAPLEQLYDYQKKAVDTTNHSSKGIICMPTSTGKTFCQAAILANDILNNKNKFKIYVVNAPRILLSYQLLKEFYSFLVMTGIEARYMFVHSGGKANEREIEEIRMRANAEGHNIPYSLIGSATQVSVIKQNIQTAYDMSLPIVLFSTYNSAQNIQFALNQMRELRDFPISMVLNDEAHYLVQEQFHDVLNVLNNDRCYFFTATTIHTKSDKGRGMNNVDAYGETLFEMTPAEAVKLGKMVRPRMHFVRTDGIYNTDDYVRSLNKIIKDTFEQHEAVLTKTKPKLLISAKGSLDMVRFMASTEYRELRQSGVDIYAIGTNENIGNDINGEKVRRPEFLKRLKQDGTNKDKKLIVLHYDILAEGIDVSGFTGIMPLRTLNKSKFLQTYGRAARLDPEDRRRIDLGELTYEDLDLMIKPYAYVIIPNIVQTNEDDKENTIELINELRSFGFNPVEEIIFTTRVNGVPEREETDSLNNIGRRLSFNGLLIDELQYELEAEEMASMDMFDYINPNEKKEIKEVEQVKVSDAIKPVDKEGNADLLDYLKTTSGDTQTKKGFFKKLFGF